MSLQHTPPPIANDPPAPTSQNVNIGLLCGICKNVMDEKIACLIIVKFHRACIENYLSKENKCPTCSIACELVDLQRATFPVGKGAVPKHYQTRRFSRNLFNDTGSSLATKHS